MGDASFSRVLSCLLQVRVPLLRLSGGAGPGPSLVGGGELALTQAGQEVLAGRRHWLDGNDLEEWRGGVRLYPGHYWCWDGAGGTLSPRA